MEDVMRLIEEYIEKHPLAVQVGGEYISQSDEAQVDAIELVCKICEALIP